MVRAPLFFANFFLRQNPKSIQGTSPHFRNLTLSIDHINGNSEELTPNIQNPDASFSLIEKGYKASGELQQIPQNPVEFLGKNQIFSTGEVAEEVSDTFGSQPRSETPLSELVSHQSNGFLRRQFYLWLKSLNQSLPDQNLCKVIFGRFVETRAAKAAKSSLEDTAFELEHVHLELYIRCLCENGLIDEAIVVFENLKMTGHCASLQTWNWALHHSLRTKRPDFVWSLYEKMMELGVVTDEDTIGYLIGAFTLEKDYDKAYSLLQQLLQTGRVPKRVVFNKLISELFKDGMFTKGAAILHIMIEKECSPDIYTYHEVLKGLCRNRMGKERIRIFNELKARGYFPDRDMYATMIKSLCEEENLSYARKLWLEMIQKGFDPDEHTYAVFIDGLLKRGHVCEAKELYKEMVNKGYGETSVMYNIMIKGLSFNHEVEEAMKLFAYMRKKGAKPERSASERLVKCLSEVNRLNDALSILGYMQKMGFELRESVRARLLSELNLLCLKSSEKIPG